MELREPLTYEDSEIRCGTALIATLHTADDFPCLDEDDELAVNMESERFGRLFAAAPEMLALLKHLNYRGGLGHYVHDKIDKVIELAENGK